MIDDKTVDCQKSLVDMRVNSLGNTELTAILQTMFDVELPSMLIFNYPTIAKLFNHIFDIFAPGDISDEPVTLTTGRSNFVSTGRAEFERPIHYE